MDILIKGIDLPEAYGPAVLTVYECIDGHGIPREYKLSASQIQAIPPHGRLIDADWIREALIHTLFTLGRMLEDASTVIEAEKGK